MVENKRLVVLAGLMLGVLPLQAERIELKTGLAKGSAWFT